VTLVCKSVPARPWCTPLFAALVGLAGCTLPTDRVAVRERQAVVDLVACRVRAPALTRAITLAEALAYAERYNIEAWAARREREFEHELATQSWLKLLPGLIAGTESRHRSELDAASSVSLQRGEQSLEASYSSAQTRRVWDITATWNLLDFGISFFQARQQANRVAIAAERERRVRQNLALEVTRAYWQAAVARVVAEEARRVALEVDATLERIQGEVASQTLPALEGLKREAALLEHQEELQRYERSYQAALAELAGLLGVPPGSQLELAEVDLDAPPPQWDVLLNAGLEDGESAAAPTSQPGQATDLADRSRTGGGWSATIAELEAEALRQRPELFEKDCEQWISRDEAHIALARLFPSFGVFWRYDWDDNPYLAFNEWSTVGLRATWDLLSLPQQLVHHRAARLHTALIEQRRLAVAVAILTQLHLALIDCRQMAEQYRLASAVAEKHRQLLVVVERASAEGKSHAGETLEQRLKWLKARARQLTAYANLMTAHARLSNTLGRDPKATTDDAPSAVNAAPTTTSANANT